MASRSVSIVVPVHSEADSLDTLFGEIREVADRNDLALEVILVDDGSRDGSWDRIVELAKSDPRVGGLRFRRNYGKAAALMAGFAAAGGEVVFMMDADLQDPPEEMPRLLVKLDEGYDLVSGWKQIRHDPWHKVYPSRVFNKLIGWATGVKLHDHVCGFKVMRRETAKRLRIYGELHRFIGVLSAADGAGVTEIPTLHRPRIRGVSKYGFTRFFKGFLDLLTVTVLTRYRWRPQHVIGGTGLVVVLLTVLSSLIATATLCVTSVLPTQLRWPFTLVGVGLPGLLMWCLTIAMPAMTLIAIGLAAELIVAQRPVDRLYEIVERVGCCAEGNEVQR